MFIGSQSSKEKATFPATHVRESYASSSPRIVSQFVAVPWIRLLFSFWLVMACSHAVHAQPLTQRSKPVAQAEETTPPPEVKVAATVNGVSIFVAEVDREVRHVMRDPKIHPDTKKLLQAQALQLLVDRVIILGYFEKTKQGASKQDVDLEFDRLAKQLKAVNRTPAEHAKNLGLDEAGLRRQFAWHLGWTKALEKSQTDENVGKYFEKNRREFDGTQIHAAHVLFKVPTIGDPQSIDETVAKAKQVRTQIAEKKLTFAEAAAQYSDAPTGKTGGDVGRIRRHEPMSESFSRAAFALEKGGVSDPVVSAFGVHLIQCLDVVPGKKTLPEVRPEVEAAMAQFLFTWLADRERANAKIEFTDALPHFRPGTQEFAP